MEGVIMKLKDMKKEELEVLSYTDLTEMILKENKKSMNTASIFKTICELLGLSDEEYANKIGDYYTSLTTDKRFILLENAEWDLKDKHKVEIVLDEDDEDEEYSEEETDEEEVENEEENMDESIEITDDEIDLDDSDDLDDLSIVDDDEIDSDI
jgi:DNA-directed RNA polymerase subunit delta